MRRSMVALGCALAWPLAAAAQTAETRGFVSVYGGWQSADGTSSQSGAFTVYDEPGSWQASQDFDGGSLFVIGGGARIAGRLGVGVAYSRATDTQAASVSVTAPHPLFFDRPRTATATPTELKHNENAFHVQALLFVPAGERFEVVVGGGPSFITVTHDVITSVGFTEGASPFTSITVSDVVVTEGDATATGFNVGAEATFFVTRNVGVGGFLRFTGASADLELGGGTIQEIDLGGFQYGVGARVRF